jgi:integrase
MPKTKFPLTLHPTGQYCKKIHGRIIYFGKDADAALQRYLDEREYLYAGRTPPSSNGESTLGVALDEFLSAKFLAKEAGELTQRSYHDYEQTCKRIAKLGTLRPLSSFDETDMQRLRKQLSRGKRGPLGPTTLRNELTRARMVFLYINDYLATKKIPYRKELRPPSRRTFRELNNKRGPKMFESKPIRNMIRTAGPQLRAMIYLGINCGFGNNDCGTLPIEQLDLANGWHNYWRPKTQNPRRCPLWPETIKALKAVIGNRTEGLVFVTYLGNCWSKDNGYNSVSAEFRKLLQRLKIYRKGITFYSLRRTFETIGGLSGEQTAVDYIMGHIAPSDDMSAVYRQKVYNQQLLKVTEFVRQWFLGETKID